MLSSRQKLLLSHLTEIANIGEPCPTLSALGARYGVHMSMISLDLQRLAAAGEIEQRVESNWRIVTIRATGRSTAPKPVRKIETERPAPPVKIPTSGAETPEEKILRIAREVRGQKSEPAPVDPIQQQLRGGRVVTAEPAPQAAPSGPEPVVVSPVEEIVADRRADAVEELIEEIETALDRDAAPIIPGMAADMAFEEGELRLTVWLSGDQRSPRSYRPFLTVPLDEAHANELLGTTAIALRDARRIRSAEL